MIIYSRVINVFFWKLLFLFFFKLPTSKLVWILHDAISIPCIHVCILYVCINSIGLSYLFYVAHIVHIYFIDEFQGQRAFYGKIPHIHVIIEFCQNLSSLSLKPYAGIKHVVVDPLLPLLILFYPFFILWYILLPIKMFESSKNQKPFGVTNIKAYVPMISDLN